MDCPEREKLKADASKALQDIIEFTNRLLKSVNNEQLASFIALDKDLENAVGAKERVFGALAQHRKDHGC